MKKRFVVLWGMAQYPHLDDDDRTKIVDEDYFTDAIGFTDHDRELYLELEIGEESNSLGSLADLLVFRIK